jgi:virulence factor
MTSSLIRVGAIGTDSSHLPEFTKRINALHAAGSSRCKVTAFVDAGDHQMPPDQVAKWRQSALDLGATQFPSIDALLSQVDVVMVLNVSGQRHLELSAPSLSRGMPTYIDKPLTCDLAQARQLLATARKGNARCYSASSLRFAAEVTGFDRKSLGTLAAIDAYGPGELNPANPGLFFYGVHTIEMVDALWGPGVSRVRADSTPDRETLDLVYHDGRHARLRLERKGSYDFGATLHGDKGIHTFKVDFADVYNRLIKGMTSFFEGGPPPAPLRDIVENVATMQAGNVSIASRGAWVEVPTIE